MKLEHQSALAPEEMPFVIFRSLFRRADYAQTTQTLSF